MSEPAGRTWPAQESSRTPPLELVILHPQPLRGHTLPVTEAPAEIGRSAELRIDSDEISRRHARIWLAGGVAWIADCDSTNGTWINGTRVVHPVRLELGQRIRMGGVEAVLQHAGIHVQDEHHTTSAPIQRPTNTTRYLCAASYIDASFAHDVISETLGQPYRACAPSYGVDMPAVVKHALAAERLRTARDLLLLLIAAVTLAAAALWLLDALPDALPDLDDLDDLSLADVPLVAALAAVPLFLAWLVVATHIFHTRVVVLGRRLSSRRFTPAAAPTPLGPTARRHVSRLIQAQRGNVVVFAGYVPFVGSGADYHGWSFAIDITKAARKDRPPKPFHSDDVHLYLAQEVAATGLPNLRLADQLFINGIDINHAPDLLPDPLAPPVVSADAEVLSAVARSPESSARVYLGVEVLGWGGQLIVTIFIRAVRLRGSLFLEGATYVLPPLAPEYSLVDRVSSDVLTGLFVAATQAAARTVPLFVSAPPRLARRWWRGTVRRRQERDDRAVIHSRGLYDYGARRSIREMAMGDDLRRFFIERDVEMFDKVVHEAVFKGIGRFLDDHGIDTGEAAQRITQITNNKIDIKGQGHNFGTVNGQNQLFGGSNNQAVNSAQKGAGT
ncbi:FHA domain-containing protein [Nonomuraea insulae]|uniref:FHA domain-containing protein n=1 Tax=Nonomuraea insulae TaxID=1616787 RepID=A0ABW1D5C1_9ACTN